MYRNLTARAAALGAAASRQASGDSTIHISVHFHVINKGASKCCSYAGAASASVTRKLQWHDAPRIHVLTIMLSCERRH